MNVRELSSLEAAVVGAALEWMEAKQGSKYGPNHKLLIRTLEHLDEACCDLAADCGEDRWSDPYE